MVANAEDNVRNDIHGKARNRDVKICGNKGNESLQKIA